MREVLKAADMLQAEGLLKHCLEAFRGGLTVHTAIEHLVWAHTEGPEEARGAAMAYVVEHMRAIQVAAPLTRVAHLHVAVSSGVFLFLFRQVAWWVLVTSIITANKRMRVEQTLTGVDVRRKTRRGRQGSWKRCRRKCLCRSLHKCTKLEACLGLDKAGAACMHCGLLSICCSLYTSMGLDSILVTPSLVLGDFQGAADEVPPQHLEGADAVNTGCVYGFCGF